MLVAGFVHYICANNIRLLLAQRYWFERKDENNSKRCALFQDEHWWWWLRSPGRVHVKAVYIHGDGNIGIQGNNILKGNLSDGRCTGGVRPALWLKLEEHGVNKA